MSSQSFRNILKWLLLAAVAAAATSAQALPERKASGGGRRLFQSAQSAVTGPSGGQQQDRAPDEQPFLAKPETAEKEWDYIVVGSGPGGITSATKLAESGASVLMLEYGGPSLYRIGGRWQAPWMKGHNVTVFDAWSTTNYIWSDRSYMCDNETEIWAACTIGGGSAVNVGQSFTPPSRYWDKFFPASWRASAIDEQVQNVRRRSPTPTTTSSDGKYYYTDVYNPVKSMLEGVGYKEVDIAGEYDQKERNFGRDVFYTVGGQRGGPVVSYLMDALKLPNFVLQSHSKVVSVVREGAKATGVVAEVRAGGPGSAASKVTYRGKRIVVAAGAFGTPKILFSSGIGPSDQLQVAKEAGLNEEDQATWLETPVGESLVENPVTTLKFTHPGIRNYSTGAQVFNNPDPMWVEKFLEERAGLYTFYGRVLVLWADYKVTTKKNITDLPKNATINVQSICSPTREQADLVGCSIYVGEGIRSKGRVIMRPDGKTAWTGKPFMSDPGDLDMKAYVEGVQDLLQAAEKHPDFVVHTPLIKNHTSYDTWVKENGSEPPLLLDSVTDKAGIKKFLKENAAKSNNHWMGSVRLGTDDGTKGGTAVVDPNCKVYGVDNLFVSDASIAPAMTTSNPVQMVMIFGEICASKMLALP